MHNKHILFYIITKHSSLTVREQMPLHHCLKPSLESTPQNKNMLPFKRKIEATKEANEDKSKHIGYIIGTFQLYP